MSSSSLVIRLRQLQNATVYNCVLRRFRCVNASVRARQMCRVSWWCVAAAAATRALHININIKHIIAHTHAAHKAKASQHVTRMCDAIFARCMMKRIRTARPAACVARKQPRAASTHCTHSIHRSLSLFALPSPPRPRSLCEPRHFAGKLQHKQDSTRYSLKAQPTLFTAVVSTYAAAGRVPRPYGCGHHRVPRRRRAPAPPSTRPQKRKVGSGQQRVEPIPDPVQPRKGEGWGGGWGAGGRAGVCYPGLVREGGKGGRGGYARAEGGVMPGRGAYLPYLPYISPAQAPCSPPWGGMGPLHTPRVSLSYRHILRAATPFGRHRPSGTDPSRPPLLPWSQAPLTPPPPLGVARID